MYSQNTRLPIPMISTNQTKPNSVMNSIFTLSIFNYFRCRTIIISHSVTASYSSNFTCYNPHHTSKHTLLFTQSYIPPLEYIFFPLEHSTERHKLKLLLSMCYKNGIEEELGKYHEIP